MSDVPRDALIEALLGAIAEQRSLLLTGPPGIGKSWLLRALAIRLERRGTPAVYLDLVLATASPERFATAASAALPDAPRLESAEAVLEALKTTPGPLLLDEPSELRALAAFPGHRDLPERFGAALAERPATILATSFPTAASRLGAFETLPVPPLAEAELAPLVGAAAAAILAGSAGALVYASALLDRVLTGEEPARAWASAMRPGGEMDRACRGIWEMLLLRSRGYGMSKAVLETVAIEEGLNLTAIVERVGRTPGAVRDYLGWLLDVDALRSEERRYYVVDPLLRDWLRLNAGGRPPSEQALEAAARERLSDAAPERVPPRRADTLMEID